MGSKSKHTSNEIQYFYYRFTIRNIKLLFSEGWKNNSLQRTIHNLCLANLELMGNGIDLGAKDGESSYYRFIDSSRSKIEYTDLDPQRKNVIQMNFENRFNIDSDYYDFALAFNVMEHIFDHEKFLSELYRILKVNGKLYLQVPFLLQFHADPNDYFRYTHQCLMRLLEDQGFRNIVICIYCVGPLTNLVNISSFLFKFRIIKISMWMIALFLDRVIRLFWKNHVNYYGGIHAKCEK